jgi:hypothetical protein
MMSWRFRQAAMMKALRAILIAAIALTIAAPALPALASAGHGLKKVHDPGRVTGTIRGRCYSRDHGQLPDPRCTPGSIDPDVTQADIRSTICKKGWTATVRPPESQTERFKYDVAYPHYGTPAEERTELDHLVPLELGGSNDATNLWPEYPPSPNPKDKVEDALNHAVCDGRVSLARAQAAIASDWMTAEKRLGIGGGSGSSGGGGSGGGGGSRAWCTATASVYYAPDDENNVYVHSNQPYTDATASADGYSWSYETNSSGYAVIYLNGPPAGAPVTVKVGSATCTATWT